MLTLILIILVLFGLGNSTFAWWLALVLGIFWFFKVWAALIVTVE